MVRFVLRQLRQARGRAYVLATALLAASSSFVLLASATKTSDLRLRGSVEAAFRPAYDILVRPRGSFTEIERSEGLVRDNYLSGLYGGISLEQHEAVKRLHGVEVAAPIANVGFLLPVGSVFVPLNELVSAEAVQLFRVRVIHVAHGGQSRYQAGDNYVYFTRSNLFEYGDGGIRELLPNGERLLVCGGIVDSAPPEDDPFDRTPHMSCYSELSPGQGTDQNLDDLSPLGQVGTLVGLSFPLLVAAIDPVEEAKLVGLDAAVTDGRYLRADDRATVSQLLRTAYRSVPVLTSTRTYVDEHVAFEIERLRVPPGVDLPRSLASRRAYGFLTGLAGEVIARRLVGPDQVYERMLSDVRIRSFNYWIPSDVEYRRATSTLEPTPVTNADEVWDSPFFGLSGSGYFPAPQANKDVQFRKLKVLVGSNVTVGGVNRTPEVRIVGRYDPARLPGFNPLSRVPLETYYPPQLLPADDAAREALGGRPLGPTQNLGDYVQQPPLLLTTLEGMRPFLNPVFFAGAKGRAKAPISAIRVRVADVEGPDEVSLARIRSVALAIRDETGLDVDITAGSSPRKLLVALPRGKFGRPRLLLEEGWVKKGVSVAFLRAADRKSVALAGLILLACAFFVGHGAYAAARTRRREIGTLVCVGWPRRAIFTMVLAELALVGLAAGIAGAALAIALAALLSLKFSLIQAILVVPVSLGLALLAGLVPAWLAARALPLDAVLPLRAGRVRRQRVHGIASMAVANLRRLPGRALLASAALLIGVASLTILLAIVEAFEGRLVGTLLGEAILVQVRSADLLSAGVATAMAGLAVADVLYLSLRERAAEIVTLRTVGWSDRHLRRLVGLEALALGGVGSAAGAAAGLALGALALQVPIGSLLLGAGLASLGGLAVALLAALAPLSQVNRLAVPAALAED